MVRPGRSATAVGLVAGLAALTGLASAPSGGAGERGAPHRAPVLGASSPDAIPGDYIVVMKPRTDSRVSGLALRQVAGGGGTVTHQYHSALNGFAAHLPPHAVEALRSNPNVAYLEADQR